MIDLRLYLAQRISALIMVPLVLGHLGMMIYAIQGGLSTGEILARTRGSYLWFLYYDLFVLAVSIHAAIGMRSVLKEWFKVPRTLLLPISLAIFLGLAWMGTQAVWAVTFG